MPEIIYVGADASGFMVIFANPLCYTTESEVRTAQELIDPSAGSIQMNNE